MGWIGCVHCEKLWCDFVARTSSLIALVQSILHRVSCSNKTNPKCTQKYQTNQYLSLGSNGVDRVRSLRKIPTRLRGTIFCTSLARLATSFVRQPNGPKCSQIVQNTPKRQFRVQCGGSGAFVAKNSDTLRGTNFCTSSARFPPNSVRQPNGPKCAQIIQNVPKHKFRVQWDASGAIVAKNSDATSWHELLHLFGPFCTEFRKATNSPKCTRIVRNAPKCQFRV